MVVVIVVAADVDNGVAAAGDRRAALLLDNEHEPDTDGFEDVEAAEPVDRGPNPLLARGQQRDYLP